MSIYKIMGFSFLSADNDQEGFSCEVPVKPEFVFVPEVFFTDDKGRGVIEHNLCEKVEESGIVAFQFSDVVP